MKTKTEIVAELKLEHLTLQSGSEETGYTKLSESDYEAIIETWADDLHAKLVAEAKTIEDEEVKKAAQDKLVALGLTLDDLKALGL